MTAKLNIVEDPRLATPQIQLTRIQKIATVEVMLTELQQIEEAASEEKTALAFFTLFVGALISAVLGVPSSDASAVRWGVHAGLSAVALLGAVWFLAVWLRKRKSAARLLGEIRERAGTVQQQMILVPSAAQAAVPAPGSTGP